MKMRFYKNYIYFRIKEGLEGKTCKELNKNQRKQTRTNNIISSLSYIQKNMWNEKYITNTDRGRVLV